MLESILIGETGLLGFSRGLSNISNNVANLNTTGYKSTTLQFADLFYTTQPFGDRIADGTALTSGSGLNVTGSTINFSQGDLRQTGNDLDAAIDGNGFFVLQDDRNTLYTRAGQFTIDREGFIATADGDARLAALVGGQQLSAMNLNSYKTTAGKATQTVNFSGNLSVNDSDGTHVVSNVSVFDIGGGSHALKATFTNNSAVTPRSWLVAVEDTAGSPLFNGEIRFRGDGSPETGFNTVTFTYTPPGASVMSLNFNFGEPGSFSGTTSFSAGTDSSVVVESQDGFAPGSLTRTTLDAEGNVVLTYSNGQTAKPWRIALANFPFLQGLDEASGSRFENRTGETVILGYADTGSFGRLVPGSIEASNVDLAEQFSELIVMQRGFQSSSQVISAANEMIQQLLDLKGRR